jgi:prepilin-type N-terminal cleavage/methylation domain-containing protein/prepilin-type processing-associated H-X9-DG protein
MTRPKAVFAVDGFSLVEVLVVIAVLAVLLGILMPALGGARSASRQAVCMGHLRGVGQGVVTYATNHQGYLPGPNTSGYEAAKAGWSYNPPANAALPIYNEDWMSPTLADALALPPDRWDRLAALFNTRLRCPANVEHYDAYFDGAVRTGQWNGWQLSDLYTASYSASMGLTVYGSNPGDPAKTWAPNWLGQIGSGALTFPDNSNLTFKLHRLGSAAQKVWAMDGARYVYYSGSYNGQITFNTQITGKRIDAGNLMDWGPGIADSTGFQGSPYKQTVVGVEGLHPHARRFAYRHDDRLNAAMLDGSVRTMDDGQSRRIDYYFPRGTVVNTPSKTNDPNDHAGYVIE